MSLSYEKQEFVHQYLKHNYNATRAAMATFDCGKSAASNKGIKMLKDPEVAAAILQLVNERNSQLKIDAQWVLDQAVTVYERCMQVEKILDRDGNPTGSFNFDAANAIKALKLIGDNVDVGAFEQRQEKAKDEQMVQRLLRGRGRAARLEDKTV